MRTPACVDLHEAENPETGKWLSAEKNIGATEPRPTGGYLKDFWWTQGVEFKNKRAEFKCKAPGEVLVKLVNDEWTVDNVEGEARVRIEVRPPPPPRRRRRPDVPVAWLVSTHMHAHTEQLTPRCKAGC
jgi:hypothetical protein